MEIKDKKTVTEVTLKLTAEEFRVFRILVGSIGGTTRYEDADLYISSRTDSSPTGINDRQSTSHADRLLARELCSKIYNHEI